MSAHITDHGPLDDLLLPLEAAIGSFLAGRTEGEPAQQACTATASVLQDIGESQAARLVLRFGSLLGVVDALAATEAIGEIRADVQPFVHAALATLRDALSSPSDESVAEFTRLEDEIDCRWGEHLSILGDELAEPSDAVPDAAAVVEAATGSSGQVEMILAALESSDDRPAASATCDAAAPEAPSHTAAQAHPFAMLSAAPDGIGPLEDTELLEAYLEDAVRCLGSMERAVLAYENDPHGPSPVEQLCRDLHTLKGASASVGLDALAAQLHEVEEALEHSDPQSADAPMELAMSCVDAVRAQIAELQRAAGPVVTQRLPDDATSPLPGLVSTASVAPPAAPALMPLVDDDGVDGTDAIRVRTSQLDQLMNLLADVVMWRSRREERLVELDAADEEISRSLFRLQAIEERCQRSSGAGWDSATGSDGRVGEYVAEIGGDLREVGQALRRSRQTLAAENRAVSQFILQFRQQLVQMKRVPLSGLFQRLHRSVRDAARAEGKEVRLETRGESTGLERSLQERLYEPLLHLVRNSVSHGIEAPDVRQAAGKPRTGTVTLEAFGSPNVLFIEVRDDGRGLDYDAIRRRGIERGLILTDRPVSRGELERLIFRPGFSTRDAANEVAGRGVGMNVVEEALHRCQCHIEIESVAGEGSCFRLTIPLRSVIEHTLLFRCGGQTFGLSMPFVKAAAHQSDEGAPELAEVSACRLADFLQLDSLQRASGASGDGGHWIDVAERVTPPLTRQGGDRAPQERRIRLLVDEILGPEEVVVRPLPPLLRRHPHVCGMTLSGTGETVLLLDGRRVLSDAARAFEASGSQSSTGACPSMALPRDTAAAAHGVLVVDDSITARRKLVRTLHGQGLAVTEAADGAAGLALLRERSFSAVFSDLEMPHVTGFDLLAELDSFASPPPCVIVTTRNEPEIQAQARRLGAAGFISKPIDDQAVCDILCTLQLTSPRPTPETCHS